jgi:hypothetical protein
MPVFAGEQQRNLGTRFQQRHGFTGVTRVKRHEASLLHDLDGKLSQQRVVLDDQDDEPRWVVPCLHDINETGHSEREEPRLYFEPLDPSKPPPCAENMPSNPDPVLLPTFV